MSHKYGSKIQNHGLLAKDKYLLSLLLIQKKLSQPLSGFTIYYFPLHISFYSRS
ncbi:hypothetical protein KFK09_027817 [Dendrobium nobile]|uniref:Uncharacterized protein n=1 Tax=Dendrobium nobile TaxID=94219 RepID=A0A8T3A0H3_DENNO|nr:hypothetical protein KFK09_027817 [Dendrobium nobile]